MILLLVIVALLAFGAVVSPLFVSESTALASGATVNNLDKLRSLKAEILNRYLSDEQAWQANQLSDRGWRNRRAFLVNRYLDVCRRLDYLDSQRK